MKTAKAKKIDPRRVFHVFLIRENRTACVEMRGDLVREDALHYLDSTRVCRDCLAKLKH